MKIIQLMIILPLSLLSLTTNADHYYNLNLGLYDFQTFSSERSQKMIVGRVGNRVNENFSFEGHLGKGLSTGDYGYYGNEIKVDTLIGLYGRLASDSNPKYNPYLLFGMSRLSHSFNTRGPNDEWDFGFGVGGSAVIRNNLKATLEFSSYYNRDSIRLDGLTLGIFANF